MDPRDLHRIEATRLQAGDVRQEPSREPALDEESMSNAWFSVRVWLLFVLWLFCLLLALGLAVPWVQSLIEQGLLPWISNP